MKVRFLKSASDFLSKFKKGDVVYLEDVRGERFVKFGDAVEVE